MVFQSAMNSLNPVITVGEQIEDVLKKHGKSRGEYNQIANFAMAQTEINIAIGHAAPASYMGKVRHQCEGGPLKLGGITCPDTLAKNLKLHCIPEGFETMDHGDYPAFLDARRRLMARKIQAYYQSL